MIRQWYEPFTFSEWLKRAFSVLNIAIFAITATLVISEFRFDWFESLVGNYLSAINETRPETGAIWKTGRQSSSAQEYLNQIINQKETVKQNAQQADSFSGLASRIISGQWVTLEKEQFKKLYLALDRTQALKIIEPAQLVWLLNGNNLDRIFCEGFSDRIKIYFVDSQNRVMRQIELTKEEIVNIEKGELSIPGKLSDIEGFQGRIYEAENFFKALMRLPEDIIPDLMVNPELLLKQTGRITRIGILNEVQNGYIQLGFEFQTGTQRQVVFVKGREWAVWQLSLNLKGELD